ncbi:MAG: disulfide bond formation protein B [Rhizomicrobium sp.]|jgi:disulfide bond formation protein DsbB
MKKIDAVQLAAFLGLVALTLILGALGFQYLARLPPCEMCMWQRYPHIAAAIIGIGGALLIRIGLVDRRAGGALVVITALLIAVSGALGVYHAGVEWHWWPGPTSCTGPAFQFQGTLDLTAPMVRCDAAAWRLFGLSLAGYNALISLGIAAGAFVLLARTKRTK